MTHHLVSTRGGTEQDVEARLGKTRRVFRAMDKLMTPSSGEEIISC